MSARFTVRVTERSGTLTPEVGGRIVFAHRDLVLGGRVRAGDVLFRIDPEEYDLTIRQRRANVSQAHQQLANERGLKAVAEEEWRLMPEAIRPEGEAKRLALREVQLESARAAVDSAEGALEAARLMRRRATLRAPFDAIVTEELADVGQVVSVGTRLATLVATDRFRVQVSVATVKLPWITLPGAGGTGGASARVSYELGSGVRAVRDGAVTRLLADLDPQGKMARLLVAIDEPIDGAGMPILLGAYVDVEIHGREAEGVFVLPRAALRNGARVWLRAPDQTLEKRDVEILWTTTDSAVVRGLEAGDEIITSPIAVAAEGLRVVTASGGEPGPMAQGDRREP